MTITIHNNHRRPLWWIFLLWPWIGRNKKSITREVCFGLNCDYDLQGTEDDFDVNKIFGIGYLWDKNDSARFGWNYNNDTKKVDLFAYYHIDGNRDFTKIGECTIGISYIMILNIRDLSYSFSVVNTNTGLSAEMSIPKTHKKKWSFNQGMYFGGTLKAPHDITIQIKKV